MDHTQRVLRSFVDLVFPQSCAGCRDVRGNRAAGAPICPGCRVALVGRARLSTPTPSPIGFPMCAAALPYDGVVRRVLLAFKEHGRHGLAAKLAPLLAAAVLALPAVPEAERIYLVPVPSARSSRRTRGYDHMSRLARAAARDLRRTGVEVSVQQLLRSTRRVADQAGLDAGRRATNLAGALVCRPPALSLGTRPGGARLVAPRAVPLVVLADDVLTTGATLTEAARAVRAAGWPAPCAAVVAATQRRSQAVARLATTCPVALPPMTERG